MQYCDYPHPPTRQGRAYYRVAPLIRTDHLSPGTLFPDVVSGAMHACQRHFSIAMAHQLRVNGVVIVEQLQEPVPSE